MYSSTVASQQAEAESRRQRERNKAKERKKRRSGSARGRTEPAAASTATAAAAKAAEEPEEFIAFSKYSDKDSQEEMDDIQMLQQEIVDEDAAEAAEAASRAQKQQQEEEEEQQQQAEPEVEAEGEEEDAQLEEEAQALLVDEDAAMEEEADGEEAEAEAEEEPEEESIAASEEQQDENEENDDDNIAVDVVDPDADEDGEDDGNMLESSADGEEESENAQPRASPTLLTPNAANRSKKRHASAMNTNSPSATPSYPSIQLSTFSFSTDQVQFDAAKHEYVLKFRQNETLCFHGSVAFSIEEGYVEINGHVFNPRSHRSRYDASTESIVQTSYFNAHSWQWQPSALLTFKAVTGGGQFAADEFVTVLRLKTCQSRFAPHKLSANANNNATRPSAVTQPYYSLAAAAPSSSSNKTPSKKNKKEKQSKSTPGMESDSSSSFLKINIPGFTPVLYSDDDFRATTDSSEGSNSQATSSSLSDTSQRFLYNSLHIPAEWDATIDTILQPQVSLQNAAAADDAEEAASSKSLSKSQQLARRVHAKNLRTEISTRGLKILVFGARNSGKSTLLSMVTNKCLNKFAKILYLDLDVGQSQFNPPGMIGLHEIDAPLLSSSTHVHTNRGMCQSKMRWSYFVGDASQQHDPSAVLHATYQAMQIYEKEYGPASGNLSLTPLVVNTQGWITGLGLELLQTTVREIVQPVYIIEVKAERDEDESTNNSRKRRAQHQDGDEDDETTSGEQILGELNHPFQLYTFRRTLDAAFASTAAAASALATAPRLRHLQLLSYFTAGNAATGSSNVMPPFSLSTYSSCLGALQTISIPFEQVCIDIIGADAQNDFHPSSVLSILNASIVGLCARTGQVEEIQGGTSQLRLRKQQAMFEPFHSQADHAAAAALLDDCIGIGVIRSVDMSSRCFHLLTPLSDQQLARVNVIKKGKLDLPNLAFGVDSYGLARMQTFDKQRLQQSHALPYLSSSSLAASSGLGTREMSSRHNIQRKRLG